MIKDLKQRNLLDETFRLVTELKGKLSVAESDKTQLQSELATEKSANATAPRAICKSPPKKGVFDALSPAPTAVIVTISFLRKSEFTFLIATVFLSG